MIKDKLLLLLKSHDVTEEKRDADGKCTKGGAVADGEKKERHQHAPKTDRNHDDGHDSNRPSWWDENEEPEATEKSYKSFAKSNMHDAIPVGQRHEGLCTTTGNDHWYHPGILEDDSDFWEGLHKSLTHDVSTEARDKTGKWTDADPAQKKDDFFYQRLMNNTTSRKVVAAVLGKDVSLERVIAGFEGSYNGMDCSVGTVERGSLRTDIPDSKSLIIRGAVTVDGATQGTFTRSIYRDSNGQLHAQHASFTIEKPFMNNGLGLHLSKHTEDFYRSIGVKDIHLEADISVGKYAWAKEGFDYENDKQRKLVTHGFARWMRQKGTPLPSDVATKLAKGHSWDVASYENGTTYHVRTYNDLTGELDVNGKFPAGKAFLLTDWNMLPFMEEPCWAGKKDLDPDSPSEEMFQRYLASKGIAATRPVVAQGA